MLTLILLVLFDLLFPLVIIYLCKKWSFLQKFGTIVLAYLFGLIIGTAGIFPKGSEGYRLAIQSESVLSNPVLESLIAGGKAVPEDIMVNKIAGIQEKLYALSLFIAFPLLLFSLNVKRWLKYARKGFLSVGLALLSGIVVVTTGFFIWKNAFPDAWKLAGMFEGIYTGGTPNFAALKLMLDVDADRFVVLFTYDTIVGAFLVLFFITLAPRLFRAILPRFEEKNGIVVDDELVKKETEGLDDFSGMLNKKILYPLFKALGLSILIAGIGMALYFLVPENYKEYKMAVAVLSITTLGILASLIKSVNSIEKTFQLGMYLILVFSLTVASTSDLRTMFGKGMWDLILFISWCYWGSMFLHLILAKIFRIDADNFLITATAFVFSPPFVPLVANALKNKDVIVTGLTGGVIGYLLGNYFGYTLAYFLKGF
ncbi:MAG TPA: hypothetical protein DEO60_06800 [Bacteroidales bacterium]|jgi:uncharacterized membrane protein|nr:hypothetical protein [Bacteroidales bacterium]HBZ20815.1 hypothetical protein [Bacteroidales bacterium]